MVLEPNVRTLTEAMKTAIDKAEHSAELKTRWTKKVAE